MPLYSTQCPACGMRGSIFRSIQARNDTETCICGVRRERVLDAPRVFGDLEAYECPVTGKRIDGWKEHQNNLARHGCRVLEPGEREGKIKETQQSINRAIDAVGESFGRLAASLPAEHQAILGSAMEEKSSGAYITRQTIKD